MSSSAMAALLVLFVLRSAEANLPDESCLLQTSAETLRRSEAAGSLHHAAFMTKTELLGASDEICKEGPKEGECLDVEQADELLQKHWKGTSSEDEEALLEKNELLDEEKQDALADLREMGCCDSHGEKQKIKGHGVELDVPLAHADPKHGWRFAPQIKLGITCPGIGGATLGLDMIDGFKVEAKAALETWCTFCGDDIVEVFSKWPDCPALEGERWRKMWEFFKTAFESGHYTTVDEQIAKDVGRGITVNSVKNMRQKKGNHFIKLKISAHIGAGAGTEFGFGWANMDGYHMFGGGGSLDLGLDESVALKVGLHTSGVGIKIIVQLSNIGFELTFKQRWWDSSMGPNPLKAINNPATIFTKWGQ